jgi:hypothetical protein
MPDGTGKSGHFPVDFLVLDKDIKPAWHVRIIAARWAAVYLTID